MAAAPISIGVRGLSWTCSLIPYLGAVEDPIQLCGALESLADLVMPGCCGLLKFEERVWTILAPPDGSSYIVYTPNGEWTSYRGMHSYQVIRIVFDHATRQMEIGQKTLDSTPWDPRRNVVLGWPSQASSKIDPTPDCLFNMGSNFVCFRRPYTMTFQMFVVGRRELQSTLRVMACIATALQWLHTHEISHGHVDPYHCRLRDEKVGEAFLAMPIYPALAFDRMKDWYQFAITFGVALFGYRFAPLSEKSDAELVEFLRAFIKRQRAASVIEFSDMEGLMKVLRDNDGDGVGWVYASLRAYVSVHQLLYQLALICKDAEKLRLQLTPQTLQELESICQNAEGCFDLNKFVSDELGRILREYFRMALIGGG